ncbi:MAG: PQQ-binding-like beta-propeller repeat protein [Planctomycetota bacterium]|nr:PQQ-binding-like beta-propeller repeat protein [Planctomycetota bacterium]
MQFVLKLTLIMSATLAEAADSDRLPEDLATRQAGVDWPGFLGSNGNGKSPEQGIITSWPAAGPRKVWELPLAEGYAMPVVARGRLLVFDRVGGQARLRCMHSETGDHLWSFTYETAYEDMYGYSNGPRCSPVIDGNRVFIFGPEGMLHCLRVSDGTLLWKVDTTRQFGVVPNFFGVGSTPVIHGDLLITQIGGSGADAADTPGGPSERLNGDGTGVVAFDKRTGKVVYTLSNELASYASPTLARAGGRNWCFVFARGGLIGFNPDQGEFDFYYPWRAKIRESVNASNPVVVNNRVFISETYGPGSALLEFSPGEVRTVWQDSPKKRRKAMQTHWNTPISHKGFLYGSSGRHSANAELRCIDWETGEVQWSEKGLARCSLLYVDGHLLCLGEYGKLRLLRANPKKFDQVAETVLLDDDPGESNRPLQYPAWAAPILSHGLLYVRGRDRLICLELIPDRNPSR